MGMAPQQQTTTTSSESSGPSLVTVTVLAAAGAGAYYYHKDMTEEELQEAGRRYVAKTKDLASQAYEVARANCNKECALAAYETVSSSVKAWFERLKAELTRPKDESRVKRRGSAWVGQQEDAYELKLMSSEPYLLTQFMPSSAETSPVCKREVEASHEESFIDADDASHSASPEESSDDAEERTA